MSLALTENFAKNLEIPLFLRYNSAKGVGMFNKKLAMKIFEGFSIERWSDFIRPISLIEMDKSCEKMAIAYILGKFEEENGRKVDWVWMIYAAFFEILRKIALCDIKSPVQRMIKQKYPEEYAKLNEWVVEQYDGLLDEPLFKMFCEYVADRGAFFSDERRLACRIFRAAHKYSAMRELELIADANKNESVARAALSLNEDLAEFLDLRGLQLFFTRQRPFLFLQAMEKLRFQTRWNQTPRVPKTSVMGHSFFVAILTLLLSRQNGTSPCPRRIFCNFFCAIFHDLPESVTRDIISPVKQATNSLPEVVKKIEDEIVRAELLPTMENFYRDELLYFTSDEFENRVLVGGKKVAVSFEELNSKYNSCEFSPVDGKLIRLADHAAAFFEADSSIKYGITSGQLVDGRKNLRKIYESTDSVNGIDPREIFWE